MHITEEEKRGMEIELRKMEVKYLRSKLHLMEKINEEMIYVKEKVKEAVGFNRRFRYADFWEKYMFTLIRITHLVDFYYAYRFKKNLIKKYWALKELKIKTQRAIDYLDPNVKEYL
jgi:hypothetical protein